MSSWFPENVSTFGGDVDGIFWLIFYITTVCFFITAGSLAARSRPGAPASSGPFITA
jgi:hypothetical protein